MRFNRNWLGNLGNSLIVLGVFLGIIIVISIMVLLVSGIDIPIWQAVLRMSIFVIISVVLVGGGIYIRKKYYRLEKRCKNDKIKVDSKIYTFVLTALGILTVYVGTGALAISESAGDIAIGYLISQIPLFIAWIVMLFFRIRYLYINRITPKPIQWLKHVCFVFKCFVRPLHMKFHKVEENGEVASKINSFLNEYSNFYNGMKISKNVTQMYQNLLFLHKIRLDRLKLRRNISFQRMKLDDIPTIRGTKVKDGKLHHIHAQEYLINQQSYIINDKTIYRVKKNVCADYDMVGADNQGADAGKQLFSCPNCGGIANSEELMTGCPFCGTKFLLEELGTRICGFSMFQEYELKKKLAIYRIDTVINWLVLFILSALVIGFYGMFYDVFILSGASLVELPFMIVLSFTSLLMSFGVFWGIGYVLSMLLRIVIHFMYQKLYLQRTEATRILKKNKEMSYKLANVMPDFSINSFFSNVRNKVAAIHYCDNKTHLQVYTKSDLTEYVKEYSNVIDCMFGPMELEEMNIEGNIQKARVYVKLLLLRWNGKEFRQEEEKLKIDLMHLAGYKSKNPYNIYSPTCPQCGSSVDLLKGNQCEYCGTELEFLNLDWCITSYSKV